jgi:hypothetical protein
LAFPFFMHRYVVVPGETIQAFNRHFVLEEENRLDTRRLSMSTTIHTGFP